MEYHNPAWDYHSGKFNDGIAERKAPKDKPVSLVGPYFIELMNKHGLTDDDVFKTRCIDCGKLFKIKHREVRCVVCSKKHQKKP